MPTGSLQLSAVFQFLSRLWLNEVDLETLQNLGQPGVRSAYVELGGSIPIKIEPETVERLAIDYCQLLIGPKNHLPPVQSIWKDQRFQSDASGSMIRYFDLISDYQSPHAIPDHLGVQLEFAAKIIAAANEQSAVQEILNQFTNDHLQWCDPFFEAVKRRAQTNFYRDLATVTQDVITTFKNS